MKPAYFFLILSQMLCFCWAQNVVLSEDFTEGLAPDWEVTTDNDKRQWQEKTYGGEYYMQMTAWGGKGNPKYDVITSLFTPALEGEQCKLKFSFADAFANGQPLSVMVEEIDSEKQYQLDEAQWSSLVNNQDYYDNVYQETAWISLPAIDSSFRIGFVYNSQKGEISTTIQLTQVEVWCE